MERAPLVSVILPTRNRAALLPRAIASVLAQSHADLELIVVDDASSDSTPALLAAIAEPRLRVLRRERNAGAAAARNAGLALARGEFVAFQDDDDIWLMQKLEAQLRALQAAPPGTGWCLCGSIRYEQGRARYIGGPAFVRQLDYRLGIGAGGLGPDWGMMATPGWLLRRELIEQAGGFDERVRSWDDWELGLRLSQRCARIVVDEPLWIQDWAQGAGLTRAARVRADDLQLILQKHGAMWAGDRRVQARHWYMIGRELALHDPAPAGRAELWRACRTNPALLRAWAALLLTFFGRALTRVLTDRVRRAKSLLRG